MPSRAEALAVDYLDREVKQLRAKLSRLEKRHALQLKEATQLKRRALLNASEAARNRKLAKEVARLSQNRNLDAEIIEEQRRQIAFLRLAASPRAMFEQ